MSEFMNTIDLLGDEETAKVIIGRTITEFNDNICESIGNYALSYCSALTSADLPNAKSIGDGAFSYCSALTSAGLPNATSIGKNAFQSCSVLASVDLPNVTSTSSDVFRSCTALTNINMPKVTNVDNIFNGCSKLSSVNIPSAQTIKSSAFTGCVALAFLDLPIVDTIAQAAFRNCRALNTIVLRRSVGICTLIGTNAFDGTPFAAGGTGGTVYVPQSLITQYQNATNWSTLYAAGTCNFVAIEGSEYE